MPFITFFSAFVVVLVLSFAQRHFLRHKVDRVVGSGDPSQIPKRWLRILEKKGVAPDSVLKEYEALVTGRFEYRHPVIIAWIVALGTTLIILIIGE